MTALSERTDQALEMHDLMRRLYPICRSITGDGVRQTLGILSEVIPLEIFEVPSGTGVFDWTVPDEWNVRAAWIKGPDGKKIVDFADHNLHLMSYSVPVHTQITLEELLPHLHSQPETPDAIPYRTSYYQRNWGFCLPHSQLEKLPDGTYEVLIDSSLEPGSLTYAECIIPGEREKEFLIYSHTCHPSLANDNLSGLVVNSHLARWLLGRDNRYTYRFVFGPGTIGSITWLAQNENRLERIKGGLVSVLLGGDNAFTYKKSRSGDSEIDAVVRYVLEELETEHNVNAFEPYGYDERQFGSPGIALDVGRITRAPNNAFPEYHSSLDNLDFVSAESLEASLALLQRTIHVFDSNRTFVNMQPKCEPQLGKRGLYGTIGGEHVREQQHAMLWILNQSDVDTSLLTIACRSGISFDTCAEVAVLLESTELLDEADRS